MTIKEVAKMFNVNTEKSRAMKNKRKAKEIMEKILLCPKCKQPMNWVEGTNICACPTCTYTIGKKENKETYSVSKTLSDKSRRFLENNYSQFAKESTEV